MEILQTLDRGLTALDHISRHPGGLSIAEVADHLDVHRAIAYRIIATLTTHGLVHRSPEGRIRLGAAVTALAGRFAPALRSVAAPVLADLADTTHATSYLAMAEGDHCVAIATAEAHEPLLRVGYRVGSRHPLNRGASGVAILASRAPRGSEPESVAEARRRGYALTEGELQPGAVGVATGISHPGNEFEACIGVVALDGLDRQAAAAAVMIAAAHLNRLTQAISE